MRTQLGRALAVVIGRRIQHILGLFKTALQGSVGVKKISLDLELFTSKSDVSVKSVSFQNNVTMLCWMITYGV